MTKPRIQKRFPLFKHQTGQWAKKVRKRTHYFGVDKDEALAKWNHDSLWLLRGLTPPREGDAAEPTVNDLCNKFLTAKKALIQSGELSRRTFASYFTVCETLVEFFGGKRPLKDLTPQDFITLRAKIAETNGPVGLSNTVQRIRTVIHFAFDTLDIAIRFGRKSFVKAKANIMRAEENRRGSRMFEADEIRGMLDSAKQPLRSMILLAVNAGLGQSDLANLPVGAIDGAWLNFPRPKTGIDRRCPLWPETCASIADWIAKRPASADESDAGLLFITKYGRPFVRTREGKSGKTIAIDGISQEFRKLLKALKIERNGNLYNLRHTHRTIADASKDQPACDFIMGHAPEGDDMASKYRERIGDDRLLAVTDVVHAWLWPKQSGPATIPFSASAG